MRDVNAKGVASGTDPDAVEVAGHEARLKADAVRVMGPDQIRMITVCTVNIAELHPDQTPSPDPTCDFDTHQNPFKSLCEVDKPA